MIYTVENLQIKMILKKNRQNFSKKNHKKKFKKKS